VNLLFRRYLNPLVAVIIGLAVFGLAVQLVTDPLSLIKSALIFGGIVAVLFLLYKRFLAKRNGSEFSDYRKAAKQSAKRYKQRKQPTAMKAKEIVSKVNNHKVSSPKTKKSSKKKRRKDHNLTVIDGKKGKKKNRAL
jgi:FtsZ-interacting cell division protein ZipA